MPTLDLTGGLRIVGAGSDVCHADETDVLLEVPGDKRWAVVGDYSRGDARVELSGALDEALYVGLLHRLADLPVDDEAAASIEDGAEGLEGACDVEVGDVDMPVVVGL